MAVRHNATALLVADVSPGGVFASVVGTLQLLNEDERKQIRAVVINKLAGDAVFFQSGKEKLESLTGLPVYVIPLVPGGVHIGEEDVHGIAEKLSQQARDGQLENHNVVLEMVVVNFPHLSNSTDFEWNPHPGLIRVTLASNPCEVPVLAELLQPGQGEQKIHKPKVVVVLPGTKSVMSDLKWLQAQDSWVQLLHHSDVTVVGICGGLQMLGREISDPTAVEGSTGTCSGLGLLNISTTLHEAKIVKPICFKIKSTLLPAGYPASQCTGYEIHCGRTQVLPDNGQEVTGWVYEDTQNIDTGGYWSSDKCWGVYTHGFFANLASWYMLLPNGTPTDLNLAPSLGSHLDEIADHVAKHLPLSELLPPTPSRSNNNNNNNISAA
eukprot:TRINITY_DN3391_c0_g2_i1.p1 TRINITY_DN3391_c0_g2~~TRINITY_DN3391_c0_g2_i1.p1  ORF type:complete len:408 (-),score=38.47 TRINITY_DN3391_c0_g2_i1:36-1178(-)